MTTWPGSSASASTTPLVGHGWVATDPAYLLTDAGAGELRALGVDVDRALAGRRPVVRPCLDWTERR